MPEMFDYIGAVLLVTVLCTAVGPAMAQKVPGSTIPLRPDATVRTLPPRAVPAPSARPAVVPPFTPPSPVAPGSGPVAGGAERDVEARQLAGQLPLDPTTANLQGRMPGDVRGTVNRLGLRVPNGTRSDLRNQPATREDVINALRH